MKTTPAKGKKKTRKKKRVASPKDKEWMANIFEVTDKEEVKK